MNIFDNYLLIITKIILKNKESLNLNNLKKIMQIRYQLRQVLLNYQMGYLLQH